MDRVQSLAPPDLRYKVVQNVAALAQLSDVGLPDGARAIVQEQNGFTTYSTGQLQYVFTRLAAPASPALVFTLSGGAQQINEGNAILSRSGYLWLRMPAYRIVQLNGTNTVDVNNIITNVGEAGSPISLTRITWRRLTVPTSAGVLLFTINDNQVQVVSDDANDDGQILMDLYPRFFYSV